MLPYVVGRLLHGVITVLCVAAVAFVLLRVTGDPLDLMLPVSATDLDREYLARALGLDRSYPVQFYYFILDAARGDFGTSIRFGQPAASLFFEALPNTLKLLAASFGFAFLAALILGVLSALRKGTTLDTAAQLLAVAGMATPNFWLGLVLIHVFAVTLGVLPVGRMGGPEHYVLPAATLGLFLVAGMMRLLRSSLIEVLDSEFIKLARIKGLTESAVIWRHALRNALIPVVSFAGVYFAYLISGAIVVETVFAWPGIGRLTYQGVMYRDFPLVQAILVLKATFVVILNLVIDIVYAYLDPRIRYR